MWSFELYCLMFIINVCSDVAGCVERLGTGYAEDDVGELLWEGRRVAGEAGNGMMAGGLGLHGLIARL